MDWTECDVAIVGGGPAGLQAALVLARTRKRVVVFDAPEPPRNAASHGIHNFVGVEGMTPSDFRNLAWEQISQYKSAELRIERVLDVRRSADGHFLVQGDAGSLLEARHVILALGFRDIHPDVPGFAECWGSTIFSCPYCDGYEKRDRMWGCVVSSKTALEHMAKIYRNWTSKARFILSGETDLDTEYREMVNRQGIAVYRGDIVEVHHVGGKVNVVTLSTGDQVDVEALWWLPTIEAQSLTQGIIAALALELEEDGQIKVDAFHQTSVKGMWAVGDVRRTPGALSAAHTGGLAALAITRVWFDEAMA